MRSIARPRAGRVLGFLVAGVVLSAGTTAARPPGDPVRVKVVEIGESRQNTVRAFHVPSVYLGPLAVRIEVEAALDFVGRLETVLQTTNDPLWQPVNVVEAGWVDIQLDVSQGERSTHDLLFHPQRSLGEFRGISWRLRGIDGAVIGRGFERTRREETEQSGPTWNLLLTPNRGEGRRRPPEQAYRAAFSYAPYRTMVIESSDFAGLDAEQQQALFDATALGRSLVVCGGSAGLPPTIAEALTDNGSLVWRGDDGKELRETAFMFGTVRSFSASLEELIECSEPVRKLVSFDGRLQANQLYFSSFPAWIWPEVVADTEEPDELGVLIWLWLSIAIVAITVLVVLAVVARRQAPLPQRSLLLLIAVVTALPFVCHRVLASNTASDFSDDSTVIWHDVGGAAQLQRVYIEGGGGGGSTPAELRYRRSSRGIWFQISSGTRWRTFVEGSTRERIESVGVGTADRQALAVLGLYSEPSEPAWIGSATWDLDGLGGRLQATGDYEMAVLVGFGGTASLGEVGIGQWIDLGEADFSQGVKNLSPDEIDVIAYKWWADGVFDRYSGSMFPSTYRDLRLTGSELLLVAREAAPPNVVHVQPIEITSITDPPAFYLKAWVPAEDLGGSYRLFIPDRLFTALGVGNKVRTGTPISFKVSDDLQAIRGDGFRILEITKPFRTRGDVGHEYIGLIWARGSQP